jgi:hypothetical protein
MYGIVLKANSCDNPMTVNETRNADTFADGMDVDPDYVAANWQQDQTANVREITVRSSRTGRPRGAYVCKHPR